MSAPKERGILFSAPMVRALLAGTKTQTRRVVKPQPLLRGKGFASWPVLPGQKGWRWTTTHDRDIPEVLAQHCPYGHLPGDRLWVRETWLQSDHSEDYGRLYFRADGEHPGDIWRPSIFMRRSSSRITLELTAVRAERLQDISERDAQAEGVSARVDPPVMGLDGVRRPVFVTAKAAYRELWDSINGAGSWAANPWVWVLAFRRAP